MKSILKFMMAVAITGLMAGIAGADISITTLTQDYIQDFNTLTNQDAGTFTWTDNTTLDGWYRRANVNNDNQTLDPDLVDYAVKGGNVGSPGFYNVSTAGNSDRAAGFRINGAPGGLKKGSLGIIFENNTGQTLTGFDVTYQGEQWYQSVNDTTLLFQWRVVDSFADINNDIDRAQAGWSAESTPLAWFVAAGGANAWVNGSTAANSTNISGSVAGMSLAPGQKLVMRWRIPLTGQGKAGLMIDDVQVNNWVAAPPATPASFYANWLTGYPSVGSSTNLTDNPDGDALDNLAEYALGGNPTDGGDAGASSGFTAVEAGGTNYYDYVYYKWTNADDRGLSYEVELSDALAPEAWTNVGYTVIEGTVSGDFESVTNRVPVVDGQKFIRLLITQQ